MGSKVKQHIWDYVLALGILLGQYFILCYLQPRDAGTFSWVRIIFPNLWLLAGAMFWYKFRPVCNLQLFSNNSPKLLTGFSILLSLALIVQLFLNKVYVPESSPVDIYKFIFLSSLVPFTEELFFRGLIFHALQRDVKNIFGAGILASLCFAGLHLPQGIDIFFFMIGLSGILCYLTFLTGNIIAGTLVHICWNAMYYNKLLALDIDRWILSIAVICLIITGNYFFQRVLSKELRGT